MRICSALVALCVGCGGETPETPDPAAPAQAAPIARSAWSAAAEAFGPKLFDEKHRARWFAEPIRPAVVLPRLIKPERYQFLQVAELRRVTADQRVGEFAFAVDGWPMALGFGMRRTADGWQVNGIAEAPVQQALIGLVEPGGLPQSDTAEPWPGGLAGKDANGRPTAAAFVLVTGAGLWVDGQPIADNAAAIQGAIRKALKGRTDLAQTAHATYRPHVALALSAGTAAKRLPELAAQAVEAGAETLMIIVRDPTGGPAFMPLAVVEEVPAGEKKLPVIRARATKDGLVLAMSLEVGEVEETLTGERPTRLQLEPILKRLQAEEKAVGILFEPAAGDHTRAVALLDLLRTAAPGVPIATRLP